MKVELLSSFEDLERVVKVLLELRPQYSKKSLLKAVQKQMKNGYTLAYVEEKGEILSVAGFVISEKLAWKKHLYIDDLVTSEKVRSKGAGKLLMDWLVGYAKGHGCEQVHLDSGVQRFEAHKFYLRENFKIASHHFSQEL